MIRNDQGQKGQMSLLARASTMLLLLTFFVGPVFDRPCRAAGLLVADGGSGGQLEIIEHNVRVTINNGVAVTEVTQVFQNLENRQVEALYTFPVPREASVANFSMWINGKEMIGEVVEKKRARQIYESYKETRRDPGLLEQSDYKTFEMRIFPIAAKARQQVKVTYYQELDYDNDYVTYVYPLATTSKKSVDSRVSGKFAFSLEVKSMIPIVEMTSTSHGQDFLIVSHNEEFFEASLEKKDGDLARDVILGYRISRSLSGLDMITAKENGDDGYFLMTLTAGEDLEKQLTGSDYVFILDVSGSMANEGKLASSRGSVEEFIKVLGSEDSFEVLAANRELKPLFQNLAAVNEQSTARAVSFLDSRQPLGGTSLLPALTVSYKYLRPERPLNVVILSDGMTEESERQALMEMIRQRPAGIRVFCIGVGNEVNRPLLTAMAEDAGGLAAFLSPGDDLVRQAGMFRRKLVHPVAESLTLKVSGVEIYDVEPKVLPNLFHGTPLRIYGRYRGAGIGKVALSGQVLGKPLVSEADLEFPQKDEANPQIERMWARHRLETLQNQLGSGSGDDQTIVDEIIRLGEAYSITSEYTSFIVLENDGEYKRWNIEQRNQLRVERDRRSREQLRAEFDRIRNKAAVNIGPGVDGDQEGRDHGQPEPLKVTADTDRELPAELLITEADRQPPRQRERQSFNLGGGGALDPLSVLISLGLCGAGMLGLRKKNDESAGR